MRASDREERFKRIYYKERCLTKTLISGFNRNSFSISNNILGGQKVPINFVKIYKSPKITDLKIVFRFRIYSSRDFFS